MTWGSWNRTRCDWSPQTDQIMIKIIIKYTPICLSRKKANGWVGYQQLRCNKSYRVMESCKTQSTDPGHTVAWRTESMCRGLPLPIHTPWTLQLLSLAVHLYSAVFFTTPFTDWHPTQIFKTRQLSTDMTTEAENPISSLYIVELISRLPVGWINNIGIHKILYKTIYKVCIKQNFYVQNGISFPKDTALHSWNVSWNL